MIRSTEAARVDAVVSTIGFPLSLSLSIYIILYYIILYYNYN